VSGGAAAGLVPRRSAEAAGTGCRRVTGARSAVRYRGLCAVSAPERRRETREAGAPTAPQLRPSPAGRPTGKRTHCSGRSEARPSLVFSNYETTGAERRGIFMPAPLTLGDEHAKQASLVGQ